MSDKEKLMLAEHILEVRYEASGTFLDARGNVADFIRQNKFLHHWKIDNYVVEFRDESDKIKTEGAFVGYKNAGYIVLNPPTRNFFAERATAFWKLLRKNGHYKLPEPTRFGTRTKVFIPSSESFDDIKEAMNDSLFSEKARTLFGGKSTDLQFTVELKDSGFDMRIMGGPIHKNEAKKYFQFESEYFEKCGLFLDLDFYRTSDLKLDAIPTLLHKAVELMWVKAERITRSLGL
jgi:hypothetical protein